MFWNLAQLKEMVMTLKDVLLGVVVVCGVLVGSQEFNLDELGTTLMMQDVPVRQPPSQFKFNKDRTPSNISTRIIGGGIATANEYPYQVALYVYVYVTLYLCGGTLITPQWVLTAAHCIEYATSVIVILGAHNLTAIESTRVVLNSTEYVVHRQWDISILQYDIGLVKLPQTVELNSYISTVPVAYGTDTYTGLISRCLGWGRTILGSVSSVLRYVDAEIITNDACDAYAEYEGIITDHHICASGDGFVGSCNGDSGGPLLVNGIQIGIVSFGVLDCSAGFPSVYTRVNEFYTWINETIESYEESSDQGSGNTGLHAVFGLAVIVGCILPIVNHF